MIRIKPLVHCCYGSRKVAPAAALGFAGFEPKGQAWVYSVVWCCCAVAMERRRRQHQDETADERLDRLIEMEEGPRSSQLMSRSEATDGN